jgi:hypothetical protein
MKGSKTLVIRHSEVVHSVQKKFRSGPFGDEVSGGESIDEWHLDVECVCELDGDN